MTRRGVARGSWKGSCKQPLSVWISDSWARNHEGLADRSRDHPSITVNTHDHTIFARSHFRAQETRARFHDHHINFRNSLTLTALTSSTSFIVKSRSGTVRLICESRAAGQMPIDRAQEFRMNFAKTPRAVCGNLSIVGCAAPPSAPATEGVLGPLLAGAVPAPTRLRADT